MSDISQRALSIARMIDRLGSGPFIIELQIPESRTERWIVCVKQPVLIRTMNLDQAHYENKDAQKKPSENTL